MINKNFLSRNRKIQFTLMNMQRLSSLDDIFIQENIDIANYWYWFISDYRTRNIFAKTSYKRKKTIKIEQHQHQQDYCTLARNHNHSWTQEVFSLLLHVFYFFYYIMKPQYTINHSNGHSASFVHLHNQGHNLSGRIYQIVTFIR